MGTFSELRSLITPSKEKTFKKGTTLASKYIVREQIGKGGMGCVYKALNNQTFDEVCIKQILGFKNQTSQLKRFKKEYEFLSKIEHRNLTKVLDYFEINNEPFYVMEFIEGEILSKIIRNKFNKFNFIDQLAIGSQIARAVEVLNTAGIIHRDIKPSNIIIHEQSGVVKLLDLGIAKDINDQKTALTAAGDIIGTPAYMSPEQVQGLFSTTSDVFSLALTLYQFFSLDSTLSFSRGK